MLSKNQPVPDQRAVTQLNTPVPMLDVSRQNGPLRSKIDFAMSEVCDSGAFVHGPACTELEKALANYCGTEHAVGCASGSDALLLALMAYGVNTGDEVILPSFTFFATAGAVWRLGAKPVFADILPDTFNIDPAEIERLISPATKAIIPVHLFGQCADMQRINAIAQADGSIAVIEDAAQAIGAKQHGHMAGSMGNVGCFSFYPTKNLGGFGDGGMITTNDAELMERLRVLRNHGQSPQYQHDLVGVNSRLDAVQAAILNIKLPKLDEWAAGRSRHAMRYSKALSQEVLPPTVAEGCESVWNQYTVRVPGGRRDGLHKFLEEKRIGSAVYYPIPLHQQACFDALGYQEGSLPYTEQAAREVLSLPVFPELTDAEQEKVLTAIESFFTAEGQNEQAA